MFVECNADIRLEKIKYKKWGGYGDKIYVGDGVIFLCRWVFKEKNSHMTFAGRKVNRDGVAKQ